MWQAIFVSLRADLSGLGNRQQYFLKLVERRLVRNSEASDNCLLLCCRVAFFFFSTELSAALFGDLFAVNLVIKAEAYVQLSLNAILHSLDTADGAFDALLNTEQRHRHDMLHVRASTVQEIWKLCSKVRDALLARGFVVKFAQSTRRSAFFVA